MEWQIENGQELSQNLPAAVTEFADELIGADGSAELQKQVACCINAFNDRTVKKLHTCLGW